MFDKLFRIKINTRIECWRLEHIISYNNYEKLIKFVVLLGLKRNEYTDLNDFEFSSNGFYQTLELKTTDDNHKLILMYVDLIPRCSEAELKRNEAQSDKLLSLGATMGNQINENK